MPAGARARAATNEGSKGPFPGFSAAWSELAQHLDVERKQLSELRKKVHTAFRQAGNATINLFHQPSAGGTTLSRRLAWDLKDERPVILIDQLSDDTANYLGEVFQFCQLPLLVIMEGEVVTESAREALLRQLREQNTRAVFIWVS